MTFSESTEILISAPYCGPLCFEQNRDCDFQVRWQINPHMRIGAVDKQVAIQQHEAFKKVLLGSGATLIEVPFLHGTFDSVFTKDTALLVESETGERKALITQPSTSVRKPEQNYRKLQLRELGFKQIIEAEQILEGGDVLFLPNKKKIFFGYGIRSSFQAIGDLQKFSDFEVVPLELVDPFFFHLDTALNFVSVGDRVVAFAYKDAFSDLGWDFLINDESLSVVIEVSRQEALMFGLNWIEVNGTVVLGSSPPFITSLLETLGKRVQVVPLEQFQLAGGSAACLATLVHKINQVQDPRDNAPIRDLAPDNSRLVQL